MPPDVSAAAAYAEWRGLLQECEAWVDAVESALTANAAPPPPWNPPTPRTAMPDDLAERARSLMSLVTALASVAQQRRDCLARRIGQLPVIAPARSSTALFVDVQA